MRPELQEILERVWSGDLDEKAAIEEAAGRGLPTEPLREILEVGRTDEFPTTLPARAGPALRLPVDGEGRIRLGPYHILDELGRGGMGIVYRARHTGLDREVALKVLLAGTDAPAEAIERFGLEARAAAHVRHENLVAVYDQGQEGDLHYFAMEYVPGRSLSALLADGPLPPNRAARIVRDAGRGLAAAHAAGILHRDIKPSNLLLGAGERVLVADFGLAKAIDGETHLTRTGVLLGTPLYMPNEQFDARSDRIGPASDVYALGATLYHALAGRPPFDGDLQPIQLLAQKELHGPPRLSRVVSGIPRDLETIAMVAMDPDSRRRYPDAQAMVEDLDRYLENRPIHARARGPVARFRLWSRRHPAAIALLLVASVGAVLGAGWWASSLLYVVAARRHVEAGDEADRAGDDVGAIAAYNLALSIDPTDEVVRRNRLHAVERLSTRAREDLRATGDAEAAGVVLEVLRQLSSPGPPEIEATEALVAALAGHRESERAFEQDLESGRQAEAGDLEVAVGRLAEQLFRIEQVAGDDAPIWADRRRRLGEVLLVLARRAVVAEEEAVFRRAQRLLERTPEVEAFDEASTIEVLVSGVDWVGGRLPVEPTVHAHRLARGRWSGDQEAAVAAGLGGPSLGRSFALAPGNHLVTVGAPDHLPARFLLVVPRRCRIRVELRLFERIDLPFEVRHVPSVAVDLADALDPPAPDDSPRGRRRAGLVEAYRLLAIEGDFLVAADELTNEDFGRIYPSEPAWRFLPVGWRADAWGPPEGEERLPVRGMSLFEAKRIAHAATQRLLPEALREGWRFYLPRESRKLGTRARLGAGPLNPFFEECEWILRYPLLGQLLGAADRTAWPEAARGNQSTDRIAPVGSYPADVSLHGLRDLEGNVAEWTGNDGKEDRFRVTGGAYPFTSPANGDLVKVQETGRRDYIGMRLVLIPAEASTTGSVALDEGAESGIVNARAVDLYRADDLLGAQALLETFLEKEPGDVRARVNASMLCLVQQKFVRAREHAAIALLGAAGNEAELARYARAMGLILEDRVTDHEVDLPALLPDLDWIVERRPRNGVVRLVRAYVRVLAGDLPGAAVDLEAVLPGYYRVARYERHLGFADLDAAQLSDDVGRAFDELVGRRLLQVFDVPDLEGAVIEPDARFARRAYPRGREYKQGKDHSGRFKKIMADALRKDVLDATIEAIRREGETKPQATGRVAGLLACLQAAIGERKGAAGTARLALLLGGEKLEVQRNEARIHVYWAEFDRALGIYEAVLEAAPDDPVARLGKAWCLVERARQLPEGERRSLHEAATACLEGVAGGERAIVGAVLALEQGEADRARALLDEAAEIDPSDAAPWIYRGVLDRRAGRNEAAAAAWSRSAALDPGYRPLVEFLMESIDR